MTAVAEGQGSISIEIGLGLDLHVGSDSKEEVEASAGLDLFHLAALEASRLRHPRPPPQTGSAPLNGADIGEAPEAMLAG